MDINDMTTAKDSVSSGEEDALVTLVVVIVAIIVAIIFIFLLGIFLDCKHQTIELADRKKIKLKISQRLKNRRPPKSEDIKSLANDMCPTAISEFQYNTRDAVV